MPSSHWDQISKITGVIMQVDPMSLLDVGVGFGKFGVLAREYLELWDGRNIYKDWKRHIDGIEVFPEYRNAIHDLIYSNVYYGNALDWMPKLLKYDLILAIDVLEHFKKEDGKQFLQLCKEHGRKTLVVTPKSPSAQTAVFGNEYETHVSKWTSDDLQCIIGNGSIVEDHRSLIWISN